MRKLLLASVAILSLGTALTAAPALAANAATALSTTAGATTGGTLGFIFGGPIGAVIGGFSGALVGSQVGDASVSFVGQHPVEQVYVSDNLGVGYHVGSNVHLYDIDGDTGHAYFYANNRAWIVDRATGKIVASPGYVVSQAAVDYARAHPTASVTISGKVGPGLKLKSGVDFSDVPGADGYGYIYLNDHPALVDAGSRTVIWVE
jgi:hypothetical protein